MDNEEIKDNEQRNDEQDQLTNERSAPAPQVSPEEAESALSRAYRQYQDDSNQDTFIEIIVRRKLQGIDYAKIAGLMLLYLVLILAAFFLSGVVPFLLTLLPLIVIGGAFGIWWLITGLNKEYEYVVTKGDLDIDIIIARRRRKRAYSVKAKDLEIMASCHSDEYRTFSKQQNIKIKNLAANPEDPKNWFLVSQFEGARTMAIISPNEKIVRNMHRFARNKVRFNPVVGL